MPIIMIPRKSQDSLTIVDSSRLTDYQVTYWDIKVIIVLWVLFFVTSIFVLLRLYSRVKILQFYAAEDYLYNLAFVSRFSSFWSLHSSCGKETRYSAFIVHIILVPSKSNFWRAIFTSAKASVKLTSLPTARQRASRDPARSHRGATGINPSRHPTYNTPNPPPSTTKTNNMIL